MSLGRFYVGDEAPKYVEIVLEDDEHDLSTVTAAQIIAKKPDGTRVVWTATFSWSAPTLTVRHELAAGGADLSAAGPWRFYAKLTFPGGVLKSDPTGTTVLGEFGESET